MKYLKRFENILNPEIGDFVIVRIDPVRRKGMDKDIKIFNMINNLESNVGEIVNIPGRVFDAKFDFTPDLKRFSFDEILRISKNREELEKFLTSKKFNI